MEEILYYDLGIAIKEACKKLYHVKGRIKIMFYSSPPKFTPPLRPAMHDVYINKGCYHFPSNTYYDLGLDYKKLLSKYMNHDNWRIFNEAKELEENVRFDHSYHMVFHNKETQLQKEYHEFMSWQEM
jgi:hypothetical protein